MDDETLQSLERLASLRSGGVLSEEEFLLAKERLLGHSTKHTIASKTTSLDKETVADIHPGEQQGVVIYNYQKAPEVPAGFQWNVMYRGGRIKGQGISLSGFELMTLVFNHSELVIFGSSSRELWHKPIKDMTAEKQSVDGVRFRSFDGESIDWLVKAGTRKRLMEAFWAIQQDR